MSGNTCTRGASYGEEEIKRPTRIVTSSIKVDGGEIARVSVKTERAVPKGKIFEVMAAIRAASVSAPVSIGDVLIKNTADTGVDVIATKTVNGK